MLNKIRFLIELKNETFPCACFQVIARKFCEYSRWNPISFTCAEARVAIPCIETASNIFIIYTYKCTCKLYLIKSI